MAERKRMGSVLSKIPPASHQTDEQPELSIAPAKKQNLFDRLNATSPLDAEPDLARIAKNVSTFVPQKTPPAEAAATDKWTVQMDSPNGPSKWTDQMDSPNGRSIPNSTPGQITKTRQQKTLFGYLAANPDCTTTINNIAEILSIPPATVRKTLRIFERAGAIKKIRLGNDGLRILFTPREWTVQMDSPNGPSTWTVQNHSKKIDREDLNLSISLKTLETSWPNLVRCGFGSDQLEQISRMLAELGKPTDRVIRGLDHAEWELEKGKMCDKTGQPVADPCAWVFQSLARTGYYRRPAGYVSPEEQAAKDAEEEARAVSLAHQKAELAQFEAWKGTLSPEELKGALQGHPGGPRDAWRL